MKQVGGIEVAHRMRTWDVSWAPGNEHRFVTGGDDCKLRFWDTRCAAGVGFVLFAACYIHCYISARQAWPLQSLVGTPYTCFAMLSGGANQRYCSLGGACSYVVLHCSAHACLLCRMLSRPEALQEMTGHSHWVWNVLFPLSCMFICALHFSCMSALQDAVTPEALQELTGHSHWV
jgi:hypothetical protein